MSERVTGPAGDIEDRWTLRAADRALLGNKTGATRLGFAVLLKLFQAEGCFPRCQEDVPAAAVEAIASQVGVAAAAWQGYDWRGRTIEYHRAQIRAALGFRAATLDDAEALGRWLDGQALALERRPDRLLAAARGRFRSQHLEPPSPERLERLVRSVLRRHEDAFCAALLARLQPGTIAGLDALLHPPDSGEAGGNDDEPGPASPLLALRSGTGQASLQSVGEEAGKLTRIRSVNLPAGLFDGVPSWMLLAYRRRVGAEELHELRRHPDPVRLTLLAAFCHVRGREIADALTELLITTVHRIGAKAEKRVEGELITDLKRVVGKPALLFKLAAASLSKPDGAVRDVVFPAVGEQTLRDLVAEGENTGPIYRRHLQTVIHNSYRSHYRRMLPLVLDALSFQSNNQAHRPVLDALGVIARHAARKMRCYPPEEAVPLDGVVPTAWRNAVLEDDARGRTRVNRTAYEICALQALREQLRCKEVWGRRRGPLPRSGPGPARRLRRATGRVLRRPQGAAGCEGIHRARAGGNDERSRNPGRWSGQQPVCPHPQARRRQDRGDAAGAPARAGGPHCAQGRDRPALVDDGATRHAEGGRPAHRLHQHAAHRD